MKLEHVEKGFLSANHENNEDRMKPQADPAQAMTLWRLVEKSDPRSLKPVRYGQRRYTEISNIYQLERATELWGPYGDFWGLKNIRFGSVGITRIRSTDKETGAAIEDEAPQDCTLEADFFYPGLNPSGTVVFPISVCLAYSRGQDTRKKLQTMAIGKALSRLGFNADVYRGEFDNGIPPQRPAASKSAGLPPNPPAAALSPDQAPASPKPQDPAKAATTAPAAAPVAPGPASQASGPAPWLRASGIAGDASQAQLDLIGREFSRLHMNAEEEQRSYAMAALGDADNRALADLTTSQASKVIRRLKAEASVKGTP